MSLVDRDEVLYELLNGEDAFPSLDSQEVLYLAELVKFDIEMNKMERGEFV